MAEFVQHRKIRQLAGFEVAFLKAFKSSSEENIASMKALDCRGYRLCAEAVWCVIWIG